jgi:hypothetical protein
MSMIISEVPGLYKLLSLNSFRKTAGVVFDAFPMEGIGRIDAIDRVLHDQAAQSPGPVGLIERPWYMHPCQDDNLMVLFGTRFVDVYSIEHGKIESFTVTPNTVYKNNKLLYDGASVLIWPRNVFHRIVSGQEGSASINLATHYDGFDITTNFNIYDLNTETGQYALIRKGEKDQKSHYTI